MSPAVKRCHLSFRHFHALRFYDHIHSPGLSAHQTQYEFCHRSHLIPFCPQMLLPQGATSSFHYQPGHLSARQIVLQIRICQMSGNSLWTVSLFSRSLATTQGWSLAGTMMQCQGKCMLLWLQTCTADLSLWQMTNVKHSCGHKNEWEALKRTLDYPFIYSALIITVYAIESFVICLNTFFSLLYSLYKFWEHTQKYGR